MLEQALVLGDRLEEAVPEGEAGVGAGGVAPAGDKWAVTSRPRGTNDHETGTYDAVLVANGHHWKPRWPRPGIAGATGFEGTQIHSHDYRVPGPFAGRRVLVLGIGNSACDIAVETSRVSRRTFLAMRRGAHILPKHLFGTPTGHLTHSWLAKAPLAVQDRGLQLLLRLSRGRLADYGLPTPAHRVLAAHPTISDDLLSRLSHGDITVKPAPRKADAGHVFFDDGSVEEIDTIIYCTGYDIAFPFLEDELIDSGDNDPGLYHRVAAPDRPGLYFIGLVQPLGAIMPLAEAQSHWVADLLEGRCALPGREEMLDEIRTYRARTARRYVASTRHTIQVDARAYLRELAKERRRRAVPR
ncbi:NAD(P)/FAD-dependent oxidoreductase [Streptomyces sp. NPDC059755]|uniref:NAD(P)/FAD-dependent oxidoreductase n=1 Tax=Streptomyces sp. NPDC059755 TaxID=3346934 RepID=UPI0036680A00